MFWQTGKSQDLVAIAAELKSTWSERNQAASFDRDAWSKIFSSSELPKLEFGTTGKHQESSVELMRALYTLGRSSLDLPFISSLAAQAAVTTELLQKFGSTQQQGKFLQKIQSGQALAAVCNSESGAGTNLRSMTSSVTETAEGHGRMTVRKPLATNASGAEVVFVSAWQQLLGRPKPTLEMFAIEPQADHTESVAHSLEAFRTGNCGSLLIPAMEIDLTSARLGESGTGLEIFRYCFDYERLYLGVLVASVLEGVEETVLETLHEREGLRDKQYVQEKAIAVTVAKTKLIALVNMVLSKGLEHLSKAQVELSLIKMLCATEAATAVQDACDLMGWRGIKNDSLIGKVARDFSALRYFGGTVELQKMTIFGHITSDVGLSRVKAA
ncbi:MAG: acyl-CoA/acyl-ACP dehydrogenase [Bdellovibrionales bacterium]|nr:acyl-CoA/acyl-ACP dehydrogenase [Bdellovibrionales bacterium]